MIRAREAKIFKKNDGLITLNILILKCITVFMKIVFLWVLAWSAHPSLVRKCCGLGTSLNISSSTISLNRRRITVIGTYSSKLHVYKCMYCMLALR